MTDALLLYGAPDASPDLFHAIPEGIVDPFLYAEAGGRRAATVSVLDADKVRGHGIEILDPSSLGADELIAAGVDPDGAGRGDRACGRRGRSASTARVVPPDFPLAVADHLRAGGIELLVDEELFVARRRAKTPAQLAGHPARAEGRRRRHGRRRGADPRVRAGRDLGVRARARCRRSATAWAATCPTT